MHTADGDNFERTDALRMVKDRYGSLRAYLERLGKGRVTLVWDEPGRRPGQRPGEFRVRLRGGEGRGQGGDGGGARAWAPGGPSSAADADADADAFPSADGPAAPVGSAANAAYVPSAAPPGSW